MKAAKGMDTRPVRIVKNYIRHAEGSCLFSMGDTSVLCVATVEETVPPHVERQGGERGWVTAEYSLLPRAGRERTPRARGAGSGRSREISRLIGRSLRGVVDMEKLGRRTVILDCDVLRADGGTRTASVNGAFVALSLALRTLYRKRLITEWPLRDWLGAVSVGIVGGRQVLDLNAAEDNAADVDLNVVMTGSGDLVEVQGTAEGAPFSRAELSRLLDLAGEGIRSIIERERAVVGAPR